MGIQKERRILDSLKGIAILGVILVHSGCSFGGYLSTIVNNGSRGVQMMFVINGYLIFKSLDNAKVSLGKWYLEKALRILPLYWIFTILHLIIFGTGTRFYLGPLPKVSWLNILCNLFCLHGFFPYYIGSINLNWFIADLAIWYLIAPLCYKILNSFEKMLIMFLVSVPVIYVILAYLEKRSLISNEVIWHDYVTTLCFFAEFPVILLGCMIFFLFKEQKVRSINGKLQCATFSFIIVCLGLLCLGSSRFYVFSNVFSWGLCFSLILIVQLSIPNTFINNSLFALFGKYSYGIYLCHIFVVHIIQNLFGESKTGKIWQVGKYLLICTLALAIAFCVENGYRWCMYWRTKGEHTKK